LRAPPATMAIACGAVCRQQARPVGSARWHHRSPTATRPAASLRRPRLRRHPRHLRHCHRHHHHRPCRRRRSPQPRSSRLRATQRRTSSTSYVSPSLANGGQAAAGAASTIVAEHRFAQQTKIAKLLMSQILTDKSDCELKVQDKCYASLAARGVLALRRLPHAPSSAWDGCARNTSERAETSVATRCVRRGSERRSSALPVWLTRCALGRSYGFAGGADRKRAGIAPGRRRLVVAVRRAAAAASRRRSRRTPSQAARRARMLPRLRCRRRRMSRG
jgi:hypothetical protein